MEHYRRELTILRDTMENVLQRRYATGPDGDVATAIGILRQFLEHVERAGARGLESARATGD